MHARPYRCSPEYMRPKSRKQASSICMLLWDIFGRCLSKVPVLGGFQPRGSPAGASSGHEDVGTGTSPSTKM